MRQLRDARRREPLGQLSDSPVSGSEREAAASPSRRREPVAELLGGAEVVAVSSTDGEPGDKERFVRGVEQALLAGEVDLGVHSAKDLPATAARRAAARRASRAREDPRDAYVGAASSIGELAAGARIGTASLRRRSQLLALRADLEVVELRGNVDTRLAQARRGRVRRHRPRGRRPAAPGPRRARSPSGSRSMR